MPQGFDWKTTFCTRPDCGSKKRVISYMLAGSWVVECGACGEHIGWLDPKKPMPIELAREVPCNYGARYYGQKFKDVPLEYIQWLYYNGTKIPPLIDYAIKAFCREGLIE